MTRGVCAIFDSFLLAWIGGVRGIECAGGVQYRILPRSWFGDDEGGKGGIMWDSEFLFDGMEGFGGR